MTETITKTCHGCKALGKWEWYGPGWFCFGKAFYKGKPGKPLRVDPDRPPKCRYAKERG